MAVAVVDRGREARKDAGVPKQRHPRVLVVEDEELIRMALESALEAEGYIVRSEAHGREAEQALEQFRPDLAILDVNLPGGPNGYAIARRLRQASRLPILFLTGADEVADRLAGFNAGADDYMAKPFAMGELLARVRALLRRSGRLTPAVWQVGDLIVDHARRSVTREGHAIELTPTEYQLLSALGEHVGQVLSREQLITRVWDLEAVDSNVVDVHISSLRRKLESHGPRLVHTVRGMGYILRP